MLSSSCGVSARSHSRLHNFSFPSLSWGSHRLFRCVKVDPRGVPPSAGPVHTAERDPLLERRRTRASEKPAAPTRREREEEEAGDGAEEGEDQQHLERFRDAVMVEFQRDVDGIALPPPLGSRRDDGNGDLDPCPPPAAEEASKPWNLRLRRAAACSAPSVAPESVVQRAKAQDQSQSLVAPVKGPAAAKRLGRVRQREAGPVKGKRPRFSAALSKEEIDEDFLLMTGSKPPRRPTKRPRNVQKQIEVLYPGFYLTEVTPDLYKTS